MRLATKIQFTPRVSKYAISSINQSNSMRFDGIDAEANSHDLYYTYFFYYLTTRQLVKLAASSAHKSTAISPRPPSLHGHCTMRNYAY